MATAASHETYLNNSLLFSVLLHGFAILLLTDFWAEQKQEEEIFTVQLVNLPTADAVTGDTPPPPPENIKTQASAAPKEAPKESKPLPPAPKADVPTVKVAEKTPKKKEEKAQPKKVEKATPVKQEEVKKRPPKLDKTPDKTKAIRNDDPDAKTVTKADDFLAALNYVDELKDKKPTPTQTQDEIAQTITEISEELTLADQAALSKLRRHIMKHWVVNANLAEKLSIKVRVSIRPDGSIQTLKITQSSGQGFFDQSLKRAVYKSSPLPFPADKYERFRDINLQFGAQK